MGFRVALSIGALSTTLFSTHSADHHAGELDLTFDAGPLDQVVNYLVPGYGKVNCVALNGTNGIYIGGHFTSFGDPNNGGTNWNGLARLLASGALDSSFSVERFAYTNNNHIDAHSIFVTADGTVWTGNGVWNRRFKPDGSAWPFSITNGFSSVTEIYRDGRVLVWDFNGGQSTIQRYLSDGSVDRGFTPFSGPQIGFRYILGNDKILTLQDQSGTNWLVRRNENGSLDNTFQPVLFPTSGGEVLAAELPDQSVYIYGQLLNGTNLHGYLARIEENGTIDKSFVPPAFPGESGQNGPRVFALAAQPDGKLLLGGDFHFTGAPAPFFEAGIVRLNWDGSVDTTFDPGTGATEGNDEVYLPQYKAKIGSIALQADGRILVTGDFRKFNGVPRDGVARIFGDPRPSSRIWNLRWRPDGQLEFQIGAAAETVQVEASDDLSRWEAVASISILNQIGTFTKSVTNSTQARFFRARSD